MNLTHIECRQRGAALTVQDYRVELDLSNAVDPGADTYRSATTLRFSSTADATWVDLVADRVARATLNGQPVDTSTYDGARLPLTGLRAENELHVEAHCRYSRTGEGMHRFTDPQDDRTYLYTHLEPTDSRRMFACFEQPDLKAQFTFVVTAPKEWEIASGQAAASRTEDELTATVTFEPTPRQSSYITAVAAGPYRRESDVWSISRPDGTTQKVRLGLLCRQSMAQFASAEEVFAITKHGLDFFDEAFAYPYPWGKYDQIFVPEYNLGAMENPGLVTFTDSFLYRGRATDLQREQRAEVIMHEMAHMWFGDLATPAWWDDLWLKESFADLMGYQTAAEAVGFPGAWILFALGRKQWAYTQDQRPSTHPIVATIDDLEAARQNFDGITYAKGAAVLKQLQAYVGRDAFFAGAQQYFADHAFGSTTLDDLLSALESSSGRDLRTWSNLWLQTAGPSLLSFATTRDEHGAITDLVIQQDAMDSMTGEAISRPHRLRVGLYALEGDRLTRVTVIDVEVAGTHTPVPEATGVSADLVIVNDDDLTYAVVRLDGPSVQAAGRHLSTIDEPLSRALVWSSLWNMVRDRALPARTFIESALAQAPTERNATLLQQILTLAHTAVCHYATPTQRPELRQRLAASALEHLRSAAPGTDAQQVWARSVARFGALHGGTAGNIEALLDGRDVIEGLPMDPDLRWELATALAAQGRFGADALAAELNRDSTMSGRLAHDKALASLPGTATKDAVWQSLVADATITNDTQRALLAGFDAPASSADRAHLADRYFASLIDWWRSMPQTMATRLVVGLFPPADLSEGQDPQQHPVIQRAKQWLDEHQSAEAALRRNVIEQAADTEHYLLAQAYAQSQV
ncbi:aminopeptidase N [Leekyejoonella antrihumi]|uniref:Aminopeptidase N n=1 Tax=Leekyejoonella antrihumi TaxID=1660198 RepID=A0A563DZ71_9MICO|nr:aminopeptidase N [Leekyejoonella antrihumi]